jgi:hypothetical protein
MAGLSLALLLISFVGGSKISRLGGLGLVSSYIIYMVWRLDV